MADGDYMYDFVQFQFRPSIKPLLYLLDVVDATGKAQTPKTMPGYQDRNMEYNHR